MYEQREKPKEKVKANNRPANLTNKAHKLSRIDDDFLAQQPNGLLQRQPKGRVSPIVSDYFQPQSSTIQRMAVGLPAAQMLALASRLLAGLATGVTLSKSLQALNKSPEFERMTSVQKMTVYAVLYKVANQAKPNKTETLPAELDAHSTTGGSEITEQGATSTSQPLTDQAILDLLGPIPASDDMTLVGNTPLPIVDDLGLGRVYSQGVRNESVLKAESKALDGSTDTVVSSSSQDAVGNASTTQVGSVVTKSEGDFADQSKLISHFEKHGAEFAAKSADEYLTLARDVMQHGTKVQYVYKGETRTGFVQIMGNNSKGQVKFAFVGTNGQGKITTLHTKSGKDFWKTLNGNVKDKVIRPAE